ncbi:MAG: hypothetical protein RQ745_13155 [Longimicrobiales bacterium]|nr:hypothetical protein [Longimicrobiales bacterium]
MPGLRRLMRLPTAWLIALVVFVIGVGVSGSVAAYRTYDWVEHDNDFCLSCHLMVEPYELFAQSAHRDLGCKACHKPTVAARSQMALTQVIDRPDSLTAHADVPDEKCISCHVDGDPEQWTLIANSAGHQVHFESSDTSLADLSCVQCHASGLHEFTATDQTCAQSGCHTDTRVTLGRMGDFTIHCVSCHSFSAPTEDASFEAAQAALAPDAGACLSCHVMRTLVEIPEDEPHQAVCASCHNPHEQETPAQAVESCATAGCHDEIEASTPFHRGLDDHPIDDCSSCHSAHEFRVEGTDCLSCHTDIFDDLPEGPTPGRRGVGGVASAIRSDARPELQPSASGVRVAFAALRHDPAPRSRLDRLSSHASAPLVQDPDGDRRFLHGAHRTLDCASCHSSTESHGALTVEDPVDCATCHHTTEISEGCESCHSPIERAGQPRLSAAWTMGFSTGVSDTRDVSFSHTDHPDAGCATCHLDGLDQPVGADACESCHVEHHADPFVACVTCHAPPPDDAHDVDSHLGCGGAGCHTEIPFAQAPREGREGCLACHTDLLDHRPEGTCVECHQLPAPTRGAP